MNFSVITPSRLRPDFLKLMVDSLYSTSKNSKETEIRIIIDKGDNSSYRAFKEIKEKYPNENIYLHDRNRGNSLVVHYYNWAAINFCLGKYIFVMNDDALFRTKDWDINVFNRLEEYMKDKPDGIIMGRPGDRHGGFSLEEVIAERAYLSYKLTNFPIISKKAIDVLGFLLDPYYLSSSADGDISELYFGVGRSIDLSDICVIHHLPLEFYELPSKIEADISVETIDFVEKKPNPIINGIDTRKEILLSYISNFKK